MTIDVLLHARPLLGATETTGEDPASTFIRLLTVFLLAMWVGFEVITKVPQRLHTPLTSGSNAISGITVVGALVVAGSLTTGFGTLFGLLPSTHAIVPLLVLNLSRYHRLYWRSISFWSKFPFMSHALFQTLIASRGDQSGTHSFTHWQCIMVQPMA